MRPIFTFLKNGCIPVLSSLLFFSEAKAQATIPSAQSLPYTQDFSTLSWSSSSYPAGWQGWSLNSSGSSTSFRTSAPLSNHSLNASSDTGIGGGGVHNYDGKIGFLARNSGGNSTDPALALAINTSGQNSIKVVFQVMTMRNPYSANQTHINNVELQYRVGSTTGTFTSLTGSIYGNNTTSQTAGTSPQNVITVTAQLPASCENKPVVQLRWVQRDSSGAGTQRPSFAIDNVSICGIPTITPNGQTDICTGSSLTLAASAGNSFLWSNGETTQSIDVSTGGNYFVTVTQSGGCSNTSLSSAVTLKPLPDVIVTSSTICSGQSTSISASGAVSYSWSTGSSSQSISINPPSTSNYTVTGTGSNGCINTAISTVNVNPLPDVSATSAIVCEGNSGTIAATGAESYSWSTGENSSSITTAPNTTTSYTVTGTDINGCQNSATAQIAVNPKPAITATASSACLGSSASVSASGAVSYSWNNGSTLSMITESPQATTDYTVTGTDANGCTNTATARITVNPLPEIILSASPSTTVCTGNAATLSATGAKTYLWCHEAGNATTDNVIVQPLATTIYTVTGTDDNGCMNSKTETISTMNLYSNFTAASSNVSTSNLNKLIMNTGCAAATAVTYTFTSNDGSAPIIKTISPFNNYLNLGSVAGLKYNTSYSVTMQPTNGTTAGCISSTATLNIGLPEINVVTCNKSVSSLNNFVMSTPCPGAMSAEWEFTPVNGGSAITKTISTFSNYCYLASVTGLNYGTAYNIRVRAMCSNCLGPWSSECTLTINQPVTSINTCNATFTSLNNLLMCNYIPGATSVEWEFVPTGGGTAFTKTVSPYSNYVNLSSVNGLELGTSYNVRVKTVTSSGSGNWSGACNLNLGSTARTGSPETINSEENTSAELNITMNVFPNPSTGLFKINASKRSLAKIYNSSGQIVTTFTIESAESNFDLSISQDGIYFLVVTSAIGERFTRRLVVHH